MSVIGDGWDYLADGASWTGDSGLLVYGRAHLWISLVATVLAVGIAVPPAVWLAHHRHLPVLSVAVVNIGRAIPTFAIIVLVLPLSIRFGFGLGFWPTCIALVALGIPPIFSNAYTGVAEVPDSTVEAATAMGMTAGQVLRRVELPTALPLLLTGVRVSAVQIVATATLGAFVGYECLGTPIVAGLARGAAGRPELVGGAVVVIVVAVSIDAAMGTLQRRLTPWTTTGRRIRPNRIASSGDRRREHP